MTRPPTLTMAEACELLGISRWTGYELVKRGEFPVPLVRLGRTIRIPTQPLLDLLGIDDQREIAGVAAPAINQTIPMPTCSEHEETGDVHRTA
ncbi:hypothetical protein BH23ACT2_BH23ACT2_07320 [soil metagenome]